MLTDIASVHEGGRHRIKDAEKAAVYQEIYVRRRATRKQIAAVLSARPTTVSRAVQELMEDGLIEPLAPPAPARPRGRPEVRLQPRLERYTALVIQGISRRLKGVLVDLGYRTLAEAEKRLDEKAGNDALYAGLSELVSDLTGRNPAGSSLVVLGLCLPGTVNGREQRWISAARWPGLDRLSLAALAGPADARLSIQRALDAELEYLLFTTPAYQRGNTLLFHWGYGIGTAYAHQGRVLRSTLGRFGEIGHVRLESRNDKPCFCGSRGCLETEAALWALLPELRRRRPDTPEDEDLFGARLAGQPLSDLPAVRRAASCIRASLNLVYQLFYPDRILLFGPFFQSDELYALLAEGFREGLPAYARDSVSLQRVAFGREGALVGSSQRFFRDALRKDLIARWET